MDVIPLDIQIEKWEVIKNYFFSDMDIIVVLYVTVLLSIVTLIVIYLWLTRKTNNPVNIMEPYIPVTYQPSHFCQLNCPSQSTSSQQRQQLLPMNMIEPSTLTTSFCNPPPYQPSSFSTNSLRSSDIFFSDSE